tara:strand:+ start:4206 stop:4415 length:210 start_codon:yes stop_codon:yes gene_type:complete
MRQVGWYPIYLKKGKSEEVMTHARLFGSPNDMMHSYHSIQRLGLVQLALDCEGISLEMGYRILSQLEIE